ncbi:reverse transcriptase domain-containing protein, partial [Nephila pilipes]
MRCEEGGVAGAHDTDAAHDPFLEAFDSGPESSPDSGHRLFTVCLSAAVAKPGWSANRPSYSKTGGATTFIRIPLKARFFGLSGRGIVPLLELCGLFRSWIAPENLLIQWKTHARFHPKTRDLLIPSRVLPEFFRGITRDVKLVAASPLAPWQKLTAIRAHVLSRAEFLCRNSHIQKRDVADLDKTLISTGKRILNLPTRANVNLVHLSSNKGGAALPHFRALLDVHAISHAFRLLASDDQLTSDVAFAGLQGVVRKKILRDPTPSECAEFLNGNKAGDFARESGDHSTLWSRARQAADRLYKYIKFSWIYNEELGCFNLNIFRSPNPVCVVPSTAGLVARLLRDDLESHYIRQLSSLVDQGKTVEVFSQHPASNHFLQAGDFTRFCDWNFIHRARLGCLQLNATMRFSKRNPKCRKCGYVRETIPHVLNHCKPHSDAWKRRHDAIQNRVARAISSSVGSVSINKKFPGIAQTLIPDMVLTKKSVLPEFFRGITRDVKLVAASPLAPWQKLTAIRAHVLSRAEFLCRNSHIQKRDVADLDKTLISTGKRILNLPTRANVNLVHLSSNKGGAALPHFRALLDVHAISHAFRLLASDDQLTSDVAFAGLQGVVRKKILRDPTPSECAEFLNGNKAGDFARESGDHSTLWSRARQAADRLYKYIKFSWIYNEELGCFNLNIFRSPNPVCVVPSTAGLVARLLRDDLESHYIRQLSSLVDQGKTVEVFSQHPASNHFLQAGDFTRFCDWNFIHRARLGCLQLNATMRFSKRNPKCRKCGYVRETIPHVLNHCKPHSDAWKRRHDAIQNRVARAISSSVGSVSINKKFPGIAQTLIPDMVLTKKS